MRSLCIRFLQISAEIPKGVPTPASADADYLPSKLQRGRTYLHSNQDSKTPPCYLIAVQLVTVTVITKSVFLHFSGPKCIKTGILGVKANGIRMLCARR